VNPKISSSRLYELSNQRPLRQWITETPIGMPWTLKA
jgi:hypothetical protein